MDCLDRLARELEARRPAALVTVTGAPASFPLRPGHKVLVGPGGLLAGDAPDDETKAMLVGLGLEALEGRKAGTRRLSVGDDTVAVYVEPYLPPPVLVVVGAGHIAQALAKMAKLIGFDVWVLDDRAEYADRRWFPDADKVVCAPFLEGLDGFRLGPGHYVVLVTRGHHYDMRCLHHIIDLPVDYIGMIGSRTRVETVFRMLEEDHGVDPAMFEKVFAPVGLDIGGRTPEEIAVSIMAEIVKERHGGTGRSLSELGRALIHDPRAGRRERDDGSRLGPSAGGVEAPGA